MVEQVIPDAGKLVELAGRCERASGPDRELDCQIYAVLQGWRYVKVMHRQKEGHFYAFRTSDGDKTVLLAPFYTKSLDAAIMLVQEGCFWSMPGLVQPLWDARINHHDGLICLPLSQPCATPALALCAAALRAQASSDTAKSEGEV